MDRRITKIVVWYDDHTFEEVFTDVKPFHLSQPSLSDEKCIVCGMKDHGGLPCPLFSSCSVKIDPGY